MGMSSFLKNALLKLIFAGDAIANIADDAVSSPATSFYVGLHTADPTEAGNQGSNETNYTDYARVAIARDGVDIVVTASEAQPAAEIAFPAVGSGGPHVLTHFSLGKASTGAGVLLFSGPLTPNITVSSGQAPKVTTDTVISLITSGE